MRSLIVAFAVAILSAPALSGVSSMSKDEFVEILEVLQQRVRNIDIEVSAKQYSVDRKSGKLKETPYSTKMRLVVDGLAGGRSRLESCMTLPWEVEGKEDRVLEGIDWYAFNGKIGTYIERNPNSKRPLSQFVLPDRPPQIAISGRFTGMDLIPAYYEDIGLAQLLRDKGDKWQIKDESDGVFLVTYLREWAGDPEDGTSIEVTVDLARGGTITSRRLLTASGEVACEYKNIILKDCGEELWMPESADYESYEGNFVWKISIRKMAVNQDIPDELFVLTFDPGYEVWDQVHNIRYTAGHNNDAAFIEDIEDVLTQMESLADPAVESHHADVDAASENSNEELATVTSPPVGRSTRGMVMGAAILAILVVLAIIIIIRRKGSLPKLLLLALWVVMGAKAFDVSACKAAEVDKGTYYEVDYFGTGIPVFQCGVYCAALQLAHFDRACDLPGIRMHLGCTKTGTDMLSLKYVLEAEGLKVQGARALTAESLAAHLRTGGTAILAITRSSGHKHFLSIMGCKDKDYASVDCPAGCQVLGKDRVKEYLVSGDGVGLLISKLAEGADADNSLVLDPPSVDLGQLSHKVESRTIEFNIANKGDRAARIRSIRAPCSCVRINPSSTWLPPGQSATMKCTVFSKAWGTATSRNIHMHFADGRYVTFVIKAKARELSPYSIVAVPNLICEDKTSFDKLDEVVRQATLKHKLGKPLAINSITSTVPWVKATVQITEGDSEGEVILRIRKMGGYGTSQGKVIFLCEGVSEPVIIVVRQEAKCPFKIIPAVVAFREGGPTSKILRVEPLHPLQPYVIEAVDSPAAVITCVWERSTVAGPTDIALVLDSEKHSGQKAWSVVKAMARLRQAGQITEIPITVILGNRGVAGTLSEGDQTEPPSLAEKKAVSR